MGACTDRVVVGGGVKIRAAGGMGDGGWRTDGERDGERERERQKRLRGSFGSRAETVLRGY